MKIAISSGHSEDVRGAAGPEPWGLDEVDEARIVTEKVADYLRAAGVECQTFHDNVSQSQSENLDRIVAWHNNTAFGGGNHDYDISVHFNAYTVTSGGRGCEVYYGSPYEMAQDISAAIYNAGDFFDDRGAKDGSHLAVVSGTREPCCLLEICFVDAQDDCEKYRASTDAICEAIAATLAGKEIPDVPEEPGERPPRPELPPADYIAMRTASTGAHVLINGLTIHSPSTADSQVVDIFLEPHGDVAMVINGELFQHSAEAPPFPGESVPTIPDNQRNIICTVFGGAADNEYSAYGPYDSQGRGPYLNDEDDYCSLPWNVPGAGLYSGLKVIAINPANDRWIRLTVADKGPWFNGSDGLDNYTETGSRPYAETLYENGDPCPSGPNEGIVPNGAGFDISPHAAAELGIVGKGLVHWYFEQPAEA